MKLIIFTLMISALYAAEPAQYETYDVTSASVGSGLKVTGKIVPLEGSIYIESARFAGRVSSVQTKEGDTIKPGTKLLLVNSAECLSLYQEKKMAKDRNLTDMFKVVESRQKQLSIVVDANSCYVVASKGGVVTKKMVEAGSNFNSGDNLFTLINRDALTVELDVPERDASKVKVGQRVIVTRPSDTKETYSTVIDAVIPSLSSVSRTVKVKLKRIDFKQNPSIEEFVFGEIETGSDGLLFKVPAASVVFSGDNDFIIKIDKDNKMSKVAVSIVNQTDDFFFIREKTSGTLHIGEKVVAKGAVLLFQAKFKNE